LTAKVEVEGRAPATTTEWVLVTGHVAPEGADFVTVPTMPLPMYILRDPPGDGSSAYLEKSTNICSVIEWEESAWKNVFGVGLKIEGGASATFWYGVGAGGIQKFLGHLYVDSKFSGGWTSFDERKVTVCLTTKDRFSTSAEEDFVGSEGDVYVGAGITFLFSEVGVIGVNGCWSNCHNPLVSSPTKYIPRSPSRSATSPTF
jgi:hypothetical protein